jgi:hypothetical protein
MMRVAERGVAVFIPPLLENNKKTSGRDYEEFYRGEYLQE